jgi:hypothetical protein
VDVRASGEIQAGLSPAPLLRAGTPQLTSQTTCNAARHSVRLTGRPTFFRSGSAHQATISSRTDINYNTSENIGQYMHALASAIAVRGNFLSIVTRFFGRASEPTGT